MLLETPTAPVDALLPLLSPDREQDDLAAWLDVEAARLRGAALLDALMAEPGIEPDFEL